MTFNTMVFVGIGSSAGALSRYMVGQTLSKMGNRQFPWGTWVVNVAGTLMLGLFSQLFGQGHPSSNWELILGTGFCGGFTTFSTMSAEAVSLFRQRPILGVIYVGSSLAFGFVLAWGAELWV